VVQVNLAVWVLLGTTGSATAWMQLGVMEITVAGAGTLLVSTGRIVRDILVYDW
jgi:hypothetical protein